MDTAKQQLRELAVLSGKGGTGKTTVAAALAALAQQDGVRTVAVDCDVDASNLFLALRPEVTDVRDYVGGSIVAVDPERCSGCGVCAEKCMFDAISPSGEVDRWACEGCGVCAMLCPAAAIVMRDRVSGRLLWGVSTWGPLIWAELQPGAGNSGKLTAEVRQAARVRADGESASLIVSDGPPGLGCPVISTLTGVDMALLVTEPSVGGVHDLARIADLCLHFGVPAMVAINKADINPGKAQEIRAWCSARGLALAAEIPFDECVPASISRGCPIVVATAGGTASPASVAIRGLWARLAAALQLRA